MIGQTISHYRIVEKLGEGGMGVVFKAEDTKLKRAVALKFLGVHLLSDAEAKERFLREAQAAAGVDHPNICHVYEIAEVDDKTFIAMAFLEGESLEDRITKRPLNIKDALDIARQVAEGLQAAHAKGIVHRDIKPANVIISPDGRATIMDFGLARLTEASRLTKVDTAMGTVAYMSPEQVQGLEVDHRSDIWALGCVLYEMVRGQRPFQGQYDQALAYEIVHQEPEPLTGVRAGVPMELEFIVGKCLAKDRDDRTASAQEVARELRTLGDKLKSGRSTILRRTNSGTGVPTTLTAASTVNPVEALPPDAMVVPRSSHRAFQAIAAVATLALLGLAFFHPAGSPPEPAEKLVLRFSFTPDSLNPAPFRRAAISPDGRRIVYTSGEDPSQLWVRDLRREEPRPLAGTEGAQAPFWSPDSSFVGFFATGQVKKVSAEGGLPTTLCQVSGPVGGGSWSPDGERIVFSQGGSTATDRGLFSVPAQGGAPTDLGVEMRSVTPYWLPAGAVEPALLYSHLESGLSPSIYLARLSGGEPLELVGGSQPVYSSTGHILYQTSSLTGAGREALSGDEIWALPFSLESLEATGPPFPIAQGVGDPSLALDGTLVSVDSAVESAGRQLVWRDRTGNRLGTIGRPQRQIFRPELSPDGSKVAVTAYEDSSDNLDIWIHEVDRAIKRRLSFDTAQEDHPKWSPDGREIIFRSMRQGAGDLFVIPVDGGGAERPFVESEYREAESHWSPDGRFLIYQVRAEDDLSYNLRYLVRRDDDEGFESVPFLERPFNDVHPRISPDGRFLAYNSNETGSNQVFVRPFPEGRGIFQVSESEGAKPRWSADGRELYFVTGSTLMAAEVNTRDGITLGPIQRLFEDPNLRGASYEYDVAPDGRFLTVEDVAERKEGEIRKPAIHVMRNWYEEFRNRE